MQFSGNCPHCGEAIDMNSLSLEPFAENKVNDFLLSVVVPVYNELNTINTIIDTIQAVDINKELILVDDCSTDGTRDILADKEKSFDNISVFYHEKNKGKGAALRTGFKHVKGDIVVIQDADLEYNPNEYHKLIFPILTDRADVVYGSRFIGEIHRVLFFWHHVGNKFLTLLSNMFTNLNLTDMETCYKIFRKSVIDTIEIKSNRFGFEPEFTAKVAKQKWRLYEIPIQYHGRDYSEGKKIGWRDGVNAIWCIFRFNLFK